jgi:hypothetical protein
VRLAITCSPSHGPDRSLDMARRRIAVGPSLSFLRKQRGLRNLLGRSRAAADAVHDALAPCLDDPRLGLCGFHYYTFNQLVDTWAWEAEKGEHRILVAEG